MWHFLSFYLAEIWLCDNSHFQSPPVLKAKSIKKSKDLIGPVVLRWKGDSSVWFTTLNHAYKSVAEWPDS